MAYIDLHTHSRASDGTVAPAELPRLAAAAGLAAVALTDHDTTAGLAEFLSAGGETPECRAVPGVELSCRFAAREIHIVGLFVDPRGAELADFLLRQRRNREDRNREMMRRLALCGYPLSPEEPEFAAVPDRSNLGRPHFASALRRRYGFGDNQEVFDRLLGHGRPAYVPRVLADPGTAIGVLHRAGGIAVWAHPVYRCRDDTAFLRRVTKTLVKLGLDALEGYYSLFGPPETERVMRVAEEFGLALSGGSDFHGANSPRIALGTGCGGLRVPEELLPLLEARRPYER